MLVDTPYQKQHFRCLTATPRIGERDRPASQAISARISAKSGSIYLDMSLAVLYNNEVGAKPTKKQKGDSEIH